MSSAAWYVNSSKRLALRNFTLAFALFFYFNLELDGHMQLLHELSVRELFQEACSQTLHSHACCLNYSMEVDLCIEAVSEIYLLALPLFRSRVGVVGAHDFICKRFWLKGGCGGSKRLYLQGFTYGSWAHFFHLEAFLWICQAFVANPCALRIFLPACLPCKQGCHGRRVRYRAGKPAGFR